MKINKITQTGLVISVWVIIAFLMSILYYWLMDIGMLWDNPEYFVNEKGNWEKNNTDWNTRKIILGTASLGFIILTIVKIINIWNKSEPQKD